MSVLLAGSTTLGTAGSGGRRRLAACLLLVRRQQHPSRHPLQRHAVRPGCHVHHDAVLLLELPLEQGAGEGRLQLALYHALHGASTKHWVVALARQVIHSGLTQDQLHLALRQALHHPACPQPHNVVDLIGLERLKDDELVDAVHKLRLEVAAHLLHDGLLDAARPCLLHLLASCSRCIGGRLRLDDLGTAQVGGHDDDGVLEAHGAAL
mmetsp:Transcript_29892/g.66118  ORF Transcript_29892/g.66118 Transcript_29892/m.66118 type:complete len:209 (-) Transcript_29892:2511-3137(-)